MLVCLTTLAGITPLADALEPEQIFDKASPSVVVIEAIGKGGGTIAFGSGVVIAPGEVITNCHVIERGMKWLVKREGHTSPAYLRFYDHTRDLCQLQASLASSFTRPVRGVIGVDDLRVGQRVYAIGAPRGLELTLTEGIISAVRQVENGSVQLIQTSVALSPGSSGGGLFDQDGHLVGITFFGLNESQNLNFALPASWVLELSSRQGDLIEQARRRQAEERTATELRRREEEFRKREEQVRAAEQAAAQAATVEEKTRPNEEANPIAGTAQRRVEPRVESEVRPEPVVAPSIELPRAQSHFQPRLTPEPIAERRPQGQIEPEPVLRAEPLPK